MKESFLQNIQYCSIIMHTQLFSLTCCGQTRNCPCITSRAAEQVVPSNHRHGAITLKTPVKKHFPPLLHRYLCWQRLGCSERSMYQSISARFKTASVALRETKKSAFKHEWNGIAFELSGPLQVPSSLPLSFSLSLPVSPPSCLFCQL